MRLFAAVAFDGTAKSKISELYAVLREAGVTGSFTPVDNLHLTLKFLGEVPAEKLLDIRAALDAAATSFSPFTLESGRCGFFSSRGEKTVWLGMSAQPLAKLAAAVDRELSAIGFEREKRAFTPHVTIARRAACDAGVFSKVQPPEFKTPVGAVTLFESRRDGWMLWYKPLHISAFGTKT